MQLEPKINKRKKSILLLGSMHTPPYCEVAHLLPALGYEIFTVGPAENNWNCDLNLVNIKSKVRGYNENLCGMGMNTVGKLREFKLESLLDMLNLQTFDFILHFQDWVLFTDLKKAPIPYFYIASEAWYPFIPKAAWHTFCSYKITHDTFRAYYPHASIGMWYTGVLSDYILQNPFEHQRIHPCTFAGKLYTFKDIYQNRREVCLYLKDKTDIFQGHWNAIETMENRNPGPECGEGLLNGSKYRELLVNSKIGLNVPTWGINFRDFEIAASGSMLLTLKTPDHDAIGFRDGINCVFYKTPEEAEEKIRYYLEHEDERIKIAKAGYELIRDEFNYPKRTMALMDKIEEMISNWYY